MSERSTFMHLPGELHLEIASYLCSAEQMMLRLTCFHLFTLVRPRNFTREEDLVVFHQSNVAEKYGLLCCSACYRVRDSSEFAEAQRVHRNLRRFCYDCSFKQIGCFFTCG
ncbi:hypothetical protein EJ05DRAFT_473405 [Pseudovirgaria hyperparasitica]|uniref:F-box domain-containing protein n=1 Tax=Pseudovirgaria hyperparasitica TaxID=470096 RepID=A0A6A6WD95_9PEZI|nr:uncharacterized protein EJ05DRAFT_473405 [Pseudovirgaria hyperparasitica]KAF2760798.1 hypothetical protein EJ05DRAFT_473405 [Pseudovirgaria hyperparasitica]